MICPQCSDALLLPGYAIDPHTLPDGSRVHNGGCFGHRNYPLKAKDIMIVFVGKCPKCGHNEELSPLVQEILKRNPPPGYTNWNDYWASHPKNILENWLEALQ